MFPIAPLQIDKLNAELLSERAGHEKHVQELRERHMGEMDTARKGFREEVAKLQREMDQLKEGSVKVRCSVYHRLAKYCIARATRINHWCVYNSYDMARVISCRNEMKLV